MLLTLKLDRAAEIRHSNILHLLNSLLEKSYSELLDGGDKLAQSVGRFLQALALCPTSWPQLCSANQIPSSQPRVFNAFKLLRYLTQSRTNIPNISHTVQISYTNSIKLSKYLTQLIFRRTQAESPPQRSSGSYGPLYRPKVRQRTCSKHRVCPDSCNKAKDSCVIC